MMSWKRTLFALLGLIIMCMAYMLDVTLKQTRIARSVAEASLAEGVDVSAVGEIVLKNPQGTIRMVREQGNTWQITEPFKAPADPETVETLLINVTGARRNNEYDVKNLAEFGLANPDVTLSLAPKSGQTFKGDQGSSFSLYLGNESTYTGQVFAKFPESRTVFTVGEHVKNTLLRSPLDFRRSRLLEIDTNNVDAYTGLRLVDQDGNVVALRNEVGRWKITEPYQIPAEDAIVREYLNKAGLLRASGFISQSSDKPTSMVTAMQALTSPTLRITLEGPPNTQPQQISVARAEGLSGSVYVAQREGSPEIMTLRAETLDDLREDASFFRSRDLFTQQPKDVGLFTIEIGRAAPTALIRNEADQWEVVGDPDFRVDQQAVEDRLQALMRVKVKEFIDSDPRDPAIYGLDIPRRRYTVTSKDKARTEVLETGSNISGSPQTVYARRGGDRSVFTVELTADLNIFPTSIADKYFARTNPDAIQRMELDVDGETYSLKREEGEWKILRPTQNAFTTVDVRKVASMLGALNSLTYERDLTGAGQTIVAPKSGPPLAIRIYGQDDRELLDANVTKKLPTTTIVETGRGRNFEVPSNAVDRLYTLVQTLVK